VVVKITDRAKSCAYNSHFAEKGLIFAACAAADRANDEDEWRVASVYD